MCDANANTTELILIQLILVRLQALLVVLNTLSYYNQSYISDFLFVRVSVLCT